MLPAGPPPLSPLRLWKWLQHPYEALASYARTYGEVFTVRIPGGLPPFVIYAQPEAVKEVFSAPGDVAHAGKANVVLKPFLGEHSLLMLDGEEHMRQRKLVMPSFHGERMHAYGAQMVDIAHASLDTWDVGRAFPVQRQMQWITLQVILRTVLGVDDAARAARFTRLLERTLAAATWPPLLLPVMQKDLGPWSPWGRFLRAGAEADAAMLEEIRRRRALGEGAGAAPLPGGSRPQTPGRTDVLALLLEARDENGVPMTDAEIRDELGTLLVAGHETTATTLSWALRYVLPDADLLARLRAEIATAERAGPLTPERIAALPLLEATIRETLRLKPVVPMVGRLLMRPMRVGAYELPAGVLVGCSIYLSHQRPAVYPDPQRFDPGRFLGTRFTPNEWYPFGGGIRRCVGMAFAMYEMKMVLAAILSRAGLRLEPGRVVRDLRRSVTVAPSDGLRVILDARRPRHDATTTAPAAMPAA